MYYIFFTFSINCFHHFYLSSLTWLDCPNKSVWAQENCHLGPEMRVLQYYKLCLLILPVNLISHRNISIRTGISSVILFYPIICAATPHPVCGNWSK